MMTTGGQILTAALERHGVDTLFMIPGIQLDWAVDALARSEQIRLFVPRHEQSTTYMADGYHRISGKPGVAMVVPGPGVLNAGAGLATAYSTNSKVLLIAGQIHSSAIGGHLGLLHEIEDQSAIIAALTKWHRRVRDANDIGISVDQAFAHMNTGRPRPVAIEIAHDLLKARANASTATPDTVFDATMPQATQADIERAAAMIDAARFPILFVGGGVLADATSSLRDLAEKIGAPVVMSDNGRGALSDRHPLGMNTLAGRALFPRADLVLVVGSRFIDSMSPTMAWPGGATKYIFINIDSADLSIPRVPALSLHSDARPALEALCASVKRRTVLATKDALRVKSWAQTQIDAVAPQIDYVREMRAALPEDGIFVNELTQVGYLARVAYPVYEPRTYVTHGYQGTLGYGFPTALGAAVAANTGVAPGGSRRRVLSITGDGGFGWNLQELATAHKYRLPVTLVVFNDGYFGNVRAIQQRTFGTEVAVKLDNPDFVALARAFSIPATRVDSPAALGAEVRASLAEDGPVLIEVVVNDMPSPWHLLRLKPMDGVDVPAAPPDPLLRVS